MNEFDFIANVLAPLAGEGAFGLTDDAGVTPSAPSGLVATVDMLVEGRHFRPDCPPDQVAKKALRANLSDLAAKGARPVCYLLSIAWPEAWDMDRRRAFVGGLREDQEAYGVTLLGGDTTATNGPATVSITAFGAPGPRGMVRRAGAQPGDAVLVTGAVGAAGLGLRVLEGDAMPEGADGEALIAAYRLPQPPVGFAGAVAQHASAAIDISDGVLADAAHIAEVSGLRLSLDLTALPLIAVARAWLEAQGDRDAALTDLATSGDDYQILLTAPPESEKALMDQADAAGVALTRIGTAEAGQGLRVTGASGEIRPSRLGFTHF